MLGASETERTNVSAETEVLLRASASAWDEVLGRSFKVLDDGSSG
jgi:hypothetical protein